MNNIIKSNIKYNTIIYFSIRNNVSHLINNRSVLVKHYTRVYNQAFNQSKGV